MLRTGSFLCFLSRPRLPFPLVRDFFLASDPSFDVFHVALAAGVAPEAACLALAAAGARATQVRPRRAPSPAWPRRARAQPPSSPAGSLPPLRARLPPPPRARAPIVGVSSLAGRRGPSPCTHRKKREEADKRGLLVNERGGEFRAVSCG